MQLKFPDNFFFGTSTAAYQIETAFEHDWLGVKSKDGYIFERTSDHEKRFVEDAAIIAHCAPNYRMSLMWSKLQRAPYAELHKDTVAEYRSFLDDLKSRGVKVMMVLHHFTNPLWFSQNGNWEKAENVALWVDFSKKVVDEFGEYISYWNTFNEPNVYVSNGWVLGQFPPFKTNLLAARSAIKNMGLAHHIMYDYIKAKFPNQPVGISHNTVIFSAENFLGYLPAKISDWWFMDYLLKPFAGKLDFFGLSYYAKISHDPQPITYIDTPAKMEKLGKPHDDMWEYYPNGLKECIERYWKQYRLPLVITESGVCTADEIKQVNAMKDYVKIIHDCLQKGIDIRGYYWWSTFDNFEWNLGPTFRFGLYETNLETKDRRKRAGADVYHQLGYERKLDL
jgi:beta-glucosidase